MSTSTMATLIGSLYTDAGVLVGIVIAAAVAGGLSLLALGFGWRHLKKYITGRKF